jgi:hypothetical protein
MTDLRDVDTLPGFDFSFDFGCVRALAQAAGVENNERKQALIEGLAQVCAWPSDHPMSRMEVLTYFESVVFRGKRLFRTVSGVAHFGPTTPEPGTAACFSRPVTGILLEPDMAIHAEPDLRTWVFGQPHGTIQFWNEDTKAQDMGKRWKVVPNAHDLPYGLFVHQATIRDASPDEAHQFLTAPSPVHEPLTLEQRWAVPGAEAKIRRMADTAREAAPFWKWTDARCLGPVIP